MKRVFRRVLLAYGFLTILPGLGRVAVEPGDTGGSTASYPLVGLTLGALFIPFGLLGGLSDLALATVLCVFSLFFSRALHADGLVDTFDGFLAGRRDKGEILRVMKDSRLGALGFIGALSVYLLKIALLYDILAAGGSVPAGPHAGGALGAGAGETTILSALFPWIGAAGTIAPGARAPVTRVPWRFAGRIPLILSVAPALSRGGVPFACALFPYAGSEKGLGKSFFETAGVRQTVAAFLLMEIFCSLTGRGSCLLLPPLLFLFWAGWGVLCARRIGGMTGDTLGAGIELSELFSLVLIRILFS
jgi:adenosylcobinamide-GDP ribazoletransferase